MATSPMLLPALVGVLVVVPLALIRAYREADDELVDAWARVHDLVLTAENRPMVRWYLRTAGMLRTWGAVAGVVLPSAFALAWSGHFEVLGVDAEGGVNPGDVGWIFLGYLVGALYAEVALARPVDPTRRTASLVPRDLDDYLPRRLLLTQRWLGAAVAAGCLASLALPYDERWIGPGAVSVVGFLAWVAAFTLGLERVQRWLIRRPQPFTEPSLVAADDAIRAQSVHAVAGAGLAVLLLMLAGTSALLAASDVAVLRWTMWLPAVAAAVLALAACQHLTNGAWRVRRAPATAAG